MKLWNRLYGCLSLTLAGTAAGAGYVVVVPAATDADEAWREVVEALQLISGERFEDDVQAWRAWQQRQVSPGGGR